MNPTCSNCIVIDNGAHQIKAGLVNQQNYNLSYNGILTDHLHGLTPMIESPNCVAKLKNSLHLLVADEIDNVQNSGLLTFMRPFERGYCTDWTKELPIWKRILYGNSNSTGSSAIGKTKGKTNQSLNNIDDNGLVSSASVSMSLGSGLSSGTLPSVSKSSLNLTSNQIEASRLIVTEPFFTPSTLQNYMDQVIFEEFGFESAIAIPAPMLSAFYNRHIKQLETTAAHQAGKNNNNKNSHQNILFSLNNNINNHNNSNGNGNNSIPTLSSQQCMQNKSNIYYDENCTISDSVSLVIESGFSFTHIVPVYKGVPFASSIRRVNIGGKVLTNLLKEVISYRQWNMMDENLLISEAKEALCYVSSNFQQDMTLIRKDSKRNKIYREFVLPDFVNTEKGYARNPFHGMYDDEDDKDFDEYFNDLGIPRENSSILNQIGERSMNMEENDTNDNDTSMNLESSGIQERKESNTSLQHRPITPSHHSSGNIEEQILKMELERFTIPEVLFYPSDIGMDSCGIAEAVLDSLKSLPPYLQGMFLSNIVLTGGNTSIPGFVPRLTSELRGLVADEFIINVSNINYGITNKRQNAFLLPGNGALDLFTERYNEKVKKQKLPFGFTPTTSLLGKKRTFSNIEEDEDETGASSTNYSSSWNSNGNKMAFEFRKNKTTEIYFPSPEYDAYRGGILLGSPPYIETYNAHCIKREDYLEYGSRIRNYDIVDQNDESTKTLLQQKESYFEQTMKSTNELNTLYKNNSSNDMMEEIQESDELEPGKRRKDGKSRPRKN